MMANNSLVIGSAEDDGQQLFSDQSVRDFICLPKSYALDNVISSVIQGLVSFNFVLAIVLKNEIVLVKPLLKLRCYLMFVRFFDPTS
jgi:hypothetical protein